MALQSDQQSNQLMRRPQNNGQIAYLNPYGNDDDAILERRALEAKNAAQAARKSIPPFVQKLSSFLDESRNTDLIRWSDNGDSFIVLDEDEFARTLIPELFKHNNYASFVRQLNMYGFHKKVGLSDNSMRASERKNKTPSEYSNPYFKRGRPLLLWLIQKPKPAVSKSKSSGRGKHEDNAEDEGEDAYDVENSHGNEYGHDETGRDFRHNLLIDQSNRSLKQGELEAVNSQLRQIRQQQQMITSMLGKIRREHEQLYNQAEAFTELHSRHENSINAILTFLATIYNRSLEGQGNQNMANLFAGAIPHDLSQQGNIVDVGNYGSQDMSAEGLVRRSSRRQPLLLKAPPTQHSESSPAPNATFHHSAQSNAQYPKSEATTPQAPSAGLVEEIYDADTPQTTTNNPPWSANSPNTQADIMSLINSTNAQDNNPTRARMDFPQVLSHLQNADGKSPLSPQQRNNVLQLMASTQGNSATPDGSNNALVSPTPPNVPSLDQWNVTERQLQDLEKTLKEQADNVAQLTNMLQPLSPSGSIPGLHDGQYVPPPEGLDLNQLFDTDQYFNDPSSIGQDFGNGGGFDFGDPSGEYSGVNDFSFDDPTGNAPDPDRDGIEPKEKRNQAVETVSSSEATSPAKSSDQGENANGQNPRKRRRRN